MTEELQPTHGLYYRFKARYLLSRQLNGAGQIKAFLEAIKAIVCG